MKIGIVNDLPLAVEALRRGACARAATIEVLWVAQDGAAGASISAPRRRPTSC